MRDKKTLRQIHRRGPLHAYIQNQVRAAFGKPKPYSSLENMKAAQAEFKQGAVRIMPLVARMVENYGMEVIDATEQELDWLMQELYDRNPWDPEGPNDPPLHSAEAWKVSMKEGAKGEIVVSVSNPKDYMQFLEEGWSPQAPAGWIAATFREYWMRLGRAIRRIK